MFSTAQGATVPRRMTIGVDPIVTERSLGFAHIDLDTLAEFKALYINRRFKIAGRRIHFVKEGRRFERLDYPDQFAEAIHWKQYKFDIPEQKEPKKAKKSR